MAVSGLRTTRFDINAEGRVIVERVKRGVDLQLAVEKTLRFLPEGQFRSADGTDLAFSAQSVCVHGDSPNGPKVVQAIRDALDAAGLQVTVPSAADGVPAADPPRRDAEWEWTEAKQCDWAWAARRAVSKQGSNSLEGG